MLLSFRDGTAKGGEELTDGIDYIHTEDVINFKHGETTKPIVIEINKNTKVLLFIDIMPFGSFTPSFCSRLESRDPRR